jgi:His/Glu/Gln/Arg/opine family amino acid ABC transporter permease subunit
LKVSSKPDAGWIRLPEKYERSLPMVLLNTVFVDWWNGIADSVYLNFIKDDRWKYLYTGMGVTLKIAFFAVLLGIVIGIIVASVRSTFELNDSRGPLLRFFNLICKTYLTVIRGTPVLLQLLIIYFVIFASVRIDKVLTASIAFGINSGAYVAEIFRSGIMSIDKGQFEAGRSLGFNYVQTMRHIILPQAFKNVLPALGNEFIVLIKETSIAGYIGMHDLTKGGDIIRSQTYDPFPPLLAAGLIYLIIVVGLSALVNRLERRLRSSDH